MCESTGHGADTPQPSSNALRIGGSHMSRKDGSAQQRRRLALGLGTGAGAALATAFISMGTAHAIPETPDPFSDLGTLGGSTLDTGLNSLSPAFAGELDANADNVVATDHDSFLSLGLPNDNV